MSALGQGQEDGQDSDGGHGGNGKPEAPQQQLLLIYTFCTPGEVTDPAGVGLDPSLPSGLGGGIRVSGVADSWRRGAAPAEQAGVGSAAVTLWEGLFCLPFALRICPAVGGFLQVGARQRGLAGRERALCAAGPAAPCSAPHCF